VLGWCEIVWRLLCLGRAASLAGKLLRRILVWPCGSLLASDGRSLASRAGLLVVELADNLGEVDGVEHFGLAAEVAVD
jgi:hypothetical protein